MGVAPLQRSRRPGGDRPGTGPDSGRSEPGRANAGNRQRGGDPRFEVWAARAVHAQIAEATGVVLPVRLWDGTGLGEKDAGYTGAHTVIARTCAGGAIPGRATAPRSPTTTTFPSPSTSSSSTAVSSTPAPTPGTRMSRSRTPSVASLTSYAGSCGSVPASGCSTSAAAGVAAGPRGRPVRRQGSASPCRRPRPRPGDSASPPPVWPIGCASCRPTTASSTAASMPWPRWACSSTSVRTTSAATSRSRTGSPRTAACSSTTESSRKMRPTSARAPNAPSCRPTSSPTGDWSRPGGRCGISRQLASSCSTWSSCGRTTP